MQYRQRYSWKEKKLLRNQKMCYERLWWTSHNKCFGRFGSIIQRISRNRYCSGFSRHLLLPLTLIVGYPNTYNNFLQRKMLIKLCLINVHTLRLINMTSRRYGCHKCLLYFVCLSFFWWKTSLLVLAKTHQHKIPNHQINLNILELVQLNQ